jgi:hypothetical protein
MIHIMWTFDPSCVVIDVHQKVALQIKTREVGGSAVALAIVQVCNILDDGMVTTLTNSTKNQLETIWWFFLPIE